jgi:hypothetical protein
MASLPRLGGSMGMSGMGGMGGDGGGMRGAMFSVPREDFAARVETR